MSEEIVELLLADVNGSPPLQLRHELRLLRDLLAAERKKLHVIQHGEPLESDAQKAAKVEVPPSGGTWCDGEVVRAPIKKGDTQYTMALNMDTGGGGLLHTAKESILVPQGLNLAARQQRMAASLGS